MFKKLMWYVKPDENKNRLAFKETAFGKLPDDIKKIEIPSYLNQQVLSQLSQTCKSANSLFQPQLSAFKLLRHIVRGEQDAAEAILKKHPELLFQQVTVTDYSGRTFKNITAFQWAIWALDRHMWTMIKKYLPDIEARKQLVDLETNGVTYELKDQNGNIKTITEKHYDFGLVTVLQEYVDNYTKWNNPQRKKYWKETVGGQQTLVTPEIVNQYCYPSSSFLPVPNFKNQTALYRNSKFVNEKTCKIQSWFPLSKVEGERLGIDFAIMRGSRERSEGQNRCYVSSDADYDLLALTDLCMARNEEYFDLISELAPELLSTNKLKIV